MSIKQKLSRIKISLKEERIVTEVDDNRLLQKAKVCNLEIVLSGRTCFNMNFVFPQTKIGVNLLTQVALWQSQEKDTFCLIKLSAEKLKLF